MPEREEEPRYVQNFALYNAPPGTVQKMGVLLLASPTRRARRVRPCWPSRTAMRSSRLPGYKTFVNPLPSRLHRPQRASDRSTRRSRI
jgi:hypothetical protein